MEIKNFALIEDVCLEFSPGLNILTGETGAGKSIIVGALNLLLGERATTDSIRTGEEESLIQGFFSLENNGAAREALKAITGLEDSELIITRQINRQGRNLCRINGLIVSLSQLKNIGKYLIDFHGQHEHQSLLDVKKHLEVLDLLCGPELISLREKYQENFKKYKKIENRLHDMSGDSDSERKRKIELYEFQLQEIEDAQLKEGEEEELEQELKLLANADLIYSRTLEAYNELSGSTDNNSISDRLEGVMALLKDVSRLDSNIAAAREQLVTAADVIRDAAREIRVISENVNFDPERLAFVEKRLAEISKLKKKYGDTLEEIFAYAEKIAAEKKELETYAERKSRYLKEKEGLLKVLNDLAAELSQRRKTKAAAVEAELKEHFNSLSLENAKLKLNFEKSELGETGFDKVEFLFTANVGEPEKPLARIVSGGEMSRVMLALKSIMAAWQWVPTLVFDELDSGIGGKTVLAVGEKILRLSYHHQVISITHWPQIAAMAGKHFRITKETAAGRTVTSVKSIKGEEIEAEIARMLDGGEKGAILQAKNILARAKKIK
ncbi:MAG TPA: DNA repair protein RecN [Firmicutes bacterium]|nr:DNA repair protein RecN [Bacillota bacterium]